MQGNIHVLNSKETRKTINNIKEQYDIGKLRPKLYILHKPGQVIYRQAMILKNFDVKLDHAGLYLPGLLAMK